MSRILILGGTGETGRRLARLLLAHTDAWLTIAARTLGRSEALAEELNHAFPGSRVTAVFADAADGASLRAAFAGHDFVVIAAPTTAHAETVARAALDAGVDYLDVQLDTGKLALLRSLSGDIERAGRMFITEAGFHPGLPSALVRFAAAHLDTVERAVSACYLNMGKALPYTEAVDEVAALFRSYRGKVYRNGRWTKDTAVEMRRVDFGGDIGSRRCYSMYFDELGPLPETYPSLEEVGFYMSESHWVTDWFVTPIVWTGAKLFPRAVRPLGRLFWWSMGTFHRPPYRVELVVHASGIKDGRAAEVQATVSHADGYDLTAIPVVATLLQVLDGSARRSGLCMMGYVAEPIRLMADMERMGVNVRVEVH